MLTALKEPHYMDPGRPEPDTSHLEQAMADVDSGGYAIRRYWHPGDDEGLHPDSWVSCSLDESGAVNVRDFLDDLLTTLVETGQQAVIHIDRDGQRREIYVEEYK